MSVPERQAQFRELLGRSHARWAGIARAYAEVSDRDDLVQEIALQVWQSLGGFTGRSSLDTWAYRVALNTALAWRRRARTRSEKLTHRPVERGEPSPATPRAVPEVVRRVTTPSPCEVSMMNRQRCAVALLSPAVPCWAGVPASSSQTPKDPWARKAVAPMVDRRVVDGLSIGYISGENSGTVHQARRMD